MTAAQDRLIVALDVANASLAQEIVGELGDAVSFYKVGLQLFTAAGPRIVSELVTSGRKVFLDLKLHDIPNTVGSAVQSAAELGVHMLTVHAAGGSKMLLEAVAAASGKPGGPIIVAVTVLTSFSQQDLGESGIQAGISEQVRHLAELAKSAGCGGVVASAHEAASLRKLLGPEIAIITPGIRPAGGGKGDQSRIASPASAILAGASQLVVGRPILGAPNRKLAATEILNEIETTISTSKTEMAGARPA